MMPLKSFEDVACAFPESLQEALSLQADEATRGVLIAGGTDLMVQWESGVLEFPPRAIHVKHLPELNGIVEQDGVISMGGSVTHMQVRRSELVQKFLPGMAAAAATIGGCQMQTQGTVAGSIANASPAGDVAPYLLAADANVVLASVRGERTIPLEKFLVGYRKLAIDPDELIVRFEIPVLHEGSCDGFRKLGPREAQAISKVMGAFRGKAEGGAVSYFAVALGSVAPTAVRLEAVERWVTGKPLNEETFAHAEKLASESVSPIDDIRSTAEYRKWVSGRLVRGFLQSMV